MTRIEDLLVLHESVRTTRERKNGSWNKTLAVIEDELFQLAPIRKQMSEIDIKNWRRIQKWVAERIGTSSTVIQSRRQLFTYKNTPDELWDQVDHGFPLRSAVLQIRRARRHGKQQDVLSSKTQDEGTKAFWTRIRSAVKTFVAQRLPDASPDEIDAEIDAFEKDLLVLCTQHQKKWRVREHQQQQTKLISRSRFCNALRTLHMDSPKRGVPLAATLAQANRQKRTLARLYHPDTNEGNETRRPQFQAVIDAYLVIEQYVRENTPDSSPRLRVVEGGKT